jgi:DNA ligase-1
MLFSELAYYFQRLEKTSSRIGITEILAELFKKSTPGEIGLICYLLQGRVAPNYESVEFGAADKFMIRAIAQAYDISPDRVTKAFKKHGDMGVAAEELHGEKRGDRVEVKKVFDAFRTIATSGGVGSQETKIRLLAELLSRANALSARYIARIPLGKLRLGFSDMTILDGLSFLIAGDKSKREELERVYNIRPDIGLLAITVKSEGLAGLSSVRAKVGAPILAALCQRLPTAGEMIAKMGEVAVEPKYDGVRVQIHCKDGKVTTYSRNLENTTDMFPELDAVGRYLAADEVILDSEAVGVDPETGKIIPFQQTVTRKRKHNIQLFSTTVPLKFFVFDILYKDRRDVLSQSFASRRKLLEETLKAGGPLTLSPQIVTKDADGIRVYHEKQRKAGLEGVVVKKWNSPYEPGRRGYAWVKFKEEEGKKGKLTDSVDAIIMGYNRGEGKRSSFGIGAFLVGVAKGETFVTVTKIGTGVSDALWRDLHAQLNAIKTVHQPKEYKDVAKSLTPDVWVAPKVVVEVAADDITKSPTHGAGYALRFPRLVRIRTDKSPGQVTTAAEVATMYKQQL